MNKNLKINALVALLFCASNLTIAQVDKPASYKGKSLKWNTFHTEKGSMEMPGKAEVTFNDGVAMIKGKMTVGKTKMGFSINEGYKVEGQYDPEQIITAFGTLTVNSKDCIGDNDCFYNLTSSQGESMFAYHKLSDDGLRYFTIMGGTGPSFFLSANPYAALKTIKGKKQMDDELKGVLKYAFWSLKPGAESAGIQAYKSQAKAQNAAINKMAGGRNLENQQGISADSREFANMVTAKYTYKNSFAMNTQNTYYGITNDMFGEGAVENDPFVIDYTYFLIGNEGRKSKDGGMIVREIVINKDYDGYTLETPGAYIVKFPADWVSSKQVLIDEKSTEKWLKMLYKVEHDDYGIVYQQIVHKGKSVAAIVLKPIAIADAEGVVEFE